MKRNIENITVSYYDDNAEIWTNDRMRPYWIPEIKKLKKYLPLGEIFEIGAGAVETHVFLLNPVINIPVLTRRPA